MIRKGNEVILNIGSPHNGFIIESVMKNGKLNGKAIMKNDKGIIIGEFVYVNGEANGLCKLYYDDGRLYFEGYLKNGYREGYGKEYDEKGNVIFEGLFKEGKRTNMITMKELKGYFKEMNEKNEIISICQKDEEGNNDGICYFYSNGKIDKVSEWKNGEELNILRRFEGKKMIEFVNGVKRYEGEYRDSMTDGYCREGEGKEYDMNGKSLIYQGQFENGKRYGQGKLYQNGEVVFDGMWIMGYPRRNLLIIESLLLIIIVVCIIASFIINVILGCIVLFLAAILLVLWRCISHVRIDSDYRLVTTVSLKNKLVVRDYCGNHLSTFSPPQFYFELLVIGDDCFENVELFNIDGLNYLKSIKIGMNSFTHVKSGKWDDDKANNRNRSFSILNCAELESIEIGGYSFSDYAGSFELRNLPKLSTIKIGEIGSKSYNFWYSSFVIKSIIDDIANE